MKFLKFTYYKRVKMKKTPLIFLLLFFLFLPSHPLYPFSLGFSVAPSYQEFYRDSKNNSQTISGFGGQVSLYGRFLPFRRLILFTDAGIGLYSSKMMDIYFGGKVGFVIYPTYQVFIGASILGHYIWTPNLSGMNLSVAAIFGSQIYKYDTGDISLIGEWTIYQPWKSMVSSHFAINLGFSFEFI
jgi:hypothetical protein